MTSSEHTSSQPSSADFVVERHRQWQHLAELVAAQREAIIGRDHQSLADINDRLHVHCRSLQADAEPPLPGQLMDDEALAELADLQLQVRAAAQVNYDLIADALACTDTMLQLLHPELCSPVYDQRGQVADRFGGLSVNRSA